MNLSVVTASTRKLLIAAPESLELCDIIESYILNLFKNDKFDFLSARRGSEGAAVMVERLPHALDVLHQGDFKLLGTCGV